MTRRWRVNGFNGDPDKVRRYASSYAASRAVSKHLAEQSEAATFKMWVADIEGWESFAVSPCHEGISLDGNYTHATAVIFRDTYQDLAA